MSRGPAAVKLDLHLCSTILRWRRPLNTSAAFYKNVNYAVIIYDISFFISCGCFAKHVIVISLPDTCKIARIK